MIRSLGIVCLGLSFLGCSTTLSPVNNGPNAPASDNKEGEVVFNPDGLDNIVEIRRKDALKKIVAVCGSNRYKIVKEETKAMDSEMPETVATFGAARLTHLHFVCDK